MCALLSHSHCSAVNVKSLAGIPGCIILRRKQPSSHLIPQKSTRAFSQSQNINPFNVTFCAGGFTCSHGRSSIRKHKEILWDTWGCETHRDQFLYDHSADPRQRPTETKAGCRGWLSGILSLALPGCGHFCSCHLQL